MSKNTDAVRDVFVYLSHKPLATSARIAKFQQSIRRFVPLMDFIIVTFDKFSKEQHHVLNIEGLKIPHFIYNRDSLATLPYPDKLPRGPFGADTFLHQGCADLPVLLFWRENDQYDNMWVCEDDVEYTGELGCLINTLRAENADSGLACTHVRRLPPDWDYIPLFSSGNEDIIEQEMRVCFLPFFCITRSALIAIDAAYTRGWAGYNEMAWAVILDHVGIRIRDIGGNGPYVAPEDRQKRYIDNSPNSFEKLGSFGTIRIRLFPGRQKNILWHPVKTPRAWLRQSGKRFKSIWSWYKNKLLRSGQLGRRKSAVPG